MSLMGMYLLIGIVCIGVYFLFLFLYRGPQEKQKVHKLVMASGSAIVFLGIASALWGTLAFTAIPTNLRDPAFGLAIAVVILGLLNGFFLTGPTLFLSGINTSWQQMRKRDRFWISFLAILQIICLAVFPLLKIPEKSLVAQGGLIVPYGANYQLRPFLGSQQIGLNNPAGVSISKKVGLSEFDFAADIHLALKPGDRVPSNLKWYDFEKELVKWFTERLDDRFDVKSKFVDFKFLGIVIGQQARNEGSIGTRENGIILGVPVSWDGTYTFRHRL